MEHGRFSLELRGPPKGNHLRLKGYANMSDLKSQGNALVKGMLNSQYYKSEREREEKKTRWRRDQDCRPETSSSLSTMYRAMEIAKQRSCFTFSARSTPWRCVADTSWACLRQVLSPRVKMSLAETWEKSLNARNVVLVSINLCLSSWWKAGDMVFGAASTAWCSLLCISSRFGWAKNTWCSKCTGNPFSSSREDPTPQLCA